MTEQPNASKGGYNPDFNLGQSIDERMQNIGDFDPHSAVVAARKMVELDRLKEQAVVGLKERINELEQKAITDELTGLLNKAGLKAAYEGLSTIARRQQRYTDKAPGHSVLFLDLDGFKAINDSIGHTDADKLLVEIGQRLKANLRESSAVGRWGGDEFIAILPNTSSEEAELIANRVRESIGTIQDVEGKSVSPSASIGVAPANFDFDLDVSVINADKAMYAAKGAGKDQVVVFSERAIA